MRDFVAVIVAVALFAFALSMATSLQWHRRGHARLRQQISRQGRSIVAEIPGDGGLAFFTADDEAFHWKEETIPKDQIRAVHVLISGAPISTSRSRRLSSHTPEAVEPSVHRANDFERDRWDVAIESADRTVVVECGAIRERVSQDLAREVFEAVRAEIESRDDA